MSSVQAVFTPFHSDFSVVKKCESDSECVYAWLTLLLSTLIRVLYATTQHKSSLPRVTFQVTHKNSIDIAIPFVLNTLQKWGNLVVTRYMRYIGHDSTSDDKTSIHRDFWF